jgi:hypothetical protein
MTSGSLNLIKLYRLDLSLYFLDLYINWDLQFGRTAMVADDLARDKADANQSEAESDSEAGQTK